MPDIRKPVHQMGMSAVFTQVVLESLDDGLVLLFKKRMIESMFANLRRQHKLTVCPLHPDDIIRNFYPRNTCPTCGAFCPKCEETVFPQECPHEHETQDIPAHEHWHLDVDVIDGINLDGGAPILEATDISETYIPVEMHDFA